MVAGEEKDFIGDTGVDWEPVEVYMGGLQKLPGLREGKKSVS